jgi:hypothetical protein
MRRMIVGAALGFVAVVVAPGPASAAPAVVTDTTQCHDYGYVECANSHLVTREGATPSDIHTFSANGKNTITTTFSDSDSQTVRSATHLQIVETPDGRPQVVVYHERKLGSGCRVSESLVVTNGEVRHQDAQREC